MTLPRALRPGGRLVIEDYDWTLRRRQLGPQLERVGEAIVTLMEGTGYERHQCRQAGTDLDRGLTDVGGEGRIRVIDSSATSSTSSD